MTPAELAEVMRSRVERTALTYSRRGPAVLPSQVDRAAALAAAWATAGLAAGVELTDIDGATDLASNALDTIMSADDRAACRASFHLAG